MPFVVREERSSAAGEQDGNRLLKKSQGSGKVSVNIWLIKFSASLLAQHKDRLSREQDPRFVHDVPATAGTRGKNLKAHFVWSNTAK